MTNRAVTVAVDGFVYDDVNGAVNRAGTHAVYGALHRIVNWALRRAVHEAVAQRGEPPHPGLALYLGSVT